MKIGNKFISLALAFAMLVGFAPASVFGASTAAEVLTFPGAEATVTYDFVAPYNADRSSMHKVNLSTITSYNEQTNPNWKFHSESSVTQHWYWNYCNAIRYSARSSSSFVAYTIKLPEVAGKYTMQLGYDGYYGAYNINAYILPTDTTNISSALTDATLVGTAHTVKESINDYGSRFAANFGILNVTSEDAGDEKILVLKAAEPIPASQSSYISNGGVYSYGFYYHDVVLSGEQMSTFDSVSLTCNTTTLSKGETAQLTIAGKMADGSRADLSDADITYTSSAPSIAAVNENGVISWKSGGTVTITVTVKVDNIESSDSVSLFCFSAEEELVFPGENASVTYDFLAPYKANPTAMTKVNLSTITSYNASTNPNWKFHSEYLSLDDEGTSNNGSHLYWNYTNSIRYGATQDTNFIAYTIKLPTTPGKYTALLGYTGYYGAYNINAYILPASTTNVSTALSGATPIGTANTIKNDPAGVSSRFTADFGVYEVSASDAGQEKILVLKAAEPVPSTQESYISDGGVGAYGFYFHDVVLSGEIPKDIVLTTDKKSLTKGKTAKLTIEDKLTDGTPIDFSTTSVSYLSSDTSVATVDSSGIVTAVNAGSVTISAIAKIGNIQKSASVKIIVAGSIKSRPSITTFEAREAILENVKKYSWAANTKNKAVSAADAYVNRTEEIYDLITTSNLYRAHQVKNDPDYRLCRYCRNDIASNAGWSVNALSNPWKVTCTSCRRSFPTNNFGAYYALGVDASTHGEWDPALSKKKNDELIAAGEKGFLVNEAYPEKNTASEPQWGVDNGFGYDTGRTFSNGVKEIHPYIGIYNVFGIWGPSWGYTGGGVVSNALASMADAYIYTGDEKYGIAGAIITDRVADIYPNMYLKPEWNIFVNSNGGATDAHNGRVLGRIADYNLAVRLCMAYDAFWPAMDNPEVIKFASERAKKYNLANTKETADLIRINCDNGLLREFRKGIAYGDIKGNVGYPQMVMAYAAVTLDTMPETKEWIDWIFETGHESPEPGISTEKGNFYSELVNAVDRDGWGDEAAPGYNKGWLNSFANVANILVPYAQDPLGYDGGNIYEFPKYKRMLYAVTEISLASRYSPLIGDSGQFSRPSNMLSIGVLTSAWAAGIKDDNFARLIYNEYGGNLSSLNTGAASKDPYKIRDEIQAVIDEKGKMMELGSRNLTGYGLAIMRDGEWTSSKDTQRAFWMYYGKTGGHGHDDTLNLDVISYGIDMASDFGDPDYKTIDCNRLTWVEVPMSHNTVFVVEKSGSNYSNYATNGTAHTADPYHFDDSGKVKVMDVDAPYFYDSTDVFRRTVVSVDANDDVSYAIDFFRVKGGDDHIYNFHAQSEEATVSGVTMVPQTDSSGSYVGSYAGPSAAYGNDPLWNSAWSTPLKYPAGFTWVKNVDRAANPTADTFSVDFKIKDYFHVLSGNPNIHLKLTMLNDGISEFAIGDVRPPLASGAPALIKQIMLRRQGTSLDSLYTVAIEPYKDSPYIESVSEVPMTVKSGTEGTNDIARAVKVTLKSGRVDYVIYATNKNVKYTVDNKLDFAGFVGVASYENGETTPSYTYMNDGTQLGSMTGVDAYTGTVVDFTKAMSQDNYITVKFNESVDLDSIKGQYIYIDNGSNGTGNPNGAFLIEDASLNPTDPTKVDLYIGLTTTIKGYAGSSGTSYNYLIANGQSFNIPLPTVKDNLAPIFTSIPGQTVEAGNTLTFKVSAKSQSGKALTYSMTESVSEMAFDANTQTFTWTPSDKNVGKTTVAFTATDGANRATMNVDITVTARSVINYSYGQKVQIGLIEPWSVKANARVYTEDAPVNIDYSALKDYGAYFIRKSELGIADATQDTLTAEDIIGNSNAVKYSKTAGTAGIDGSYLTATYDKGIYTYEMSDSVFVMFYIEDASGIHYAPIRERNIKSLLDERKNNTEDFTNELERNVYASMSTLESDTLKYRAQFDNIEELPEQTAPTLAEFVAENGAFTAETVKSYTFGNKVQIVLKEPWGLRFSARVYNDENPINIDYSKVEYGAIVYYDTGKTVESMTPEQLMAKEDAYVFSNRLGDATIDGSYIAALYNKGIYTYQLDSNAYVMFYVKDENGYHYGDVKVRNAYELAKQRKDDTSGAFGVLERAVYSAMVKMYDDIKKYRDDYFKNN